VIKKSNPYPTRNKIRSGTRKTRGSNFVPEPVPEPAGKITIPRPRARGENMMEKLCINRCHLSYYHEKNRKYIGKLNGYRNGK
jgi:hypothetical protein